MYGLVDCNNFYASCERVFNPALNNKPLVVLSNNDGCVIARSNEAKAMGIPMGAPAFEFEELFVKHDVKVFSANFALYGDMSSRVMDLLKGYCPEIEIYSIDEAFLDFKSFTKNYDLKAYGEKMAYHVRKATGIPVSVGFAPTKALAKVANRIAKKYPEQTKGVFVMDTLEKRIKALKWLKIEDVWGVGRQHAKRLNAIGVVNAYDFTELNDQWVKKNMAIVGVRLQKELKGIETLGLEEKAPKKNIATTRSFDRSYTNISDLQERVSTFVVISAEKLRRQNSCCNAVMVFLNTNFFRTDQPQYNKSIVVRLPYATNSSIDITKYALQGLEIIFKPGYQYKKAGVMLLDFCNENEIQHTLFEAPNPQHKILMRTVDKLNAAIGQQKVKLAIQDKDRVWKMKQEKLSRRFTTKLNEVIEVCCE
ncbi:Y-family DNA polymerase [Lacihabitans soyangensis]|uniref:Y-family DNA polymerase n=1 Tax=Lacihabitans soyangensis TaxID=869394 RepID=A0AAE3KXJ7_9BACT|nr:Y-family DNA polymerase [Lacihabitans soyangensis]MCP9765175.1 Y-family DNA polymerase [Lacihabitans soyangensis]